MAVDNDFEHHIVNAFAFFICKNKRLRLLFSAQQFVNRNSEKLCKFGQSHNIRTGNVVFPLGNSLSRNGELCSKLLLCHADPAPVFCDS